MDTEIFAAQYRKLADTNLITCHPGINCDVGVSSKGVVTRTTNSNAKPIVSLLGALPDDIMENYFAIVSKGMDIHIGKEYSDKLLLQNNVQVNDQHAIILINITNPGISKLKFNLTPDIQGLMATTMQSFLLSTVQSHLHRIH